MNSTRDQDAELACEGSPGTPSSFRACLQTLWRAFKFVLTFLKPFIVATVYAILGALIFMACEQSNDLAQRQQEQTDKLIARKKLLTELHSISIKVSSTYLTERFEQVLQEYEQKMGIYETLNEEVQSVWDIWSAVLFAATIYTTIGYGNIACVTFYGRLATILYASMGIPLMVSVLNDLGQTLMTIVKTSTESTKHCCRYIGRMSRTSCGNLTSCAQSTWHSLWAEQLDNERLRNMLMTGALEPDVSRDDHKSAEIDLLLEGESIPEINESDEKEDPPVAVSFFVTIAWIFLCASIFQLWEAWTYFEAFYFFFISLSTIGFGDITPAQPKYTIITFPLVLIGLAMVSVCFNVINEQLELVYMSLLRSLLNDYTLAAGGQGDKQMTSGMGIMGRARKAAVAKVLMPMMSSNTRESAMNKFKEEAKAQGIELPAALTDIDQKSGFPSIMSVEPGKLESWVQEREVEQEHKLQGLCKESQTAFSHPSIEVQTTEQVKVEVPCQEQIVQATPETNDVNLQICDEWLDALIDRPDTNITFESCSSQTRVDTVDIGTWATHYERDMQAQTDSCFFDMYSRANQVDVKLTGGAVQVKREMTEVGVQTGILARVQHIFGPGGDKRPSDPSSSQPKGPPKQIELPKPSKYQQQEKQAGVGDLKSKFERSRKTSIRQK